MTKGKYLEKERWTFLTKKNRNVSVFIPQDDLGILDEYRKGDPFGIEKNIKSTFHRNRISNTLGIISSFDQDKKKLRLLDIGCGQGHITNEITKNFSEIDVSGIDISLTAIEYACDNYREIDFVVGNAYDLPYISHYFDIVVCNNMWEHINNPVCLLKNIKKVLRENGILVISTPNRYRITNLLRVLIGKRVLINNHHITEYTIGQMKELFQSGGFVIKQIKSTSIQGQGGSLFSKIFIYKILKPCLNFFFKVLGSHHTLEATVFYIVEKK